MKEMIAKTLQILLLTALVSGCTYTQHLWNVHQITPKKIEASCKPTDFHLVGPGLFGTQMRVLQYDTCLGIENVLIVLWYGENSEINELSAKLLALLYVQSWNINKEQQHGWRHLKTAGLGDGRFMVIYEMVRVDFKKPKMCTDRESCHPE